MLLEHNSVLGIEAEHELTLVYDGQSIRACYNKQRGSLVFAKTCWSLRITDTLLLSSAFENNWYVITSLQLCAMPSCQRNFDIVIGAIVDDVLSQQSLMQTSH